MSKEKIKEQLLELMMPRLKKAGLAPHEINDDVSLLSQGVFDSLAFIEFIVEVEESFQVEFDFSEMDAGDFTSLGQLSKLISDIKASQ